MALPAALSDVRCFFERDPSLSLARRSTVEGVGTCLLVIAMVGAGLAVKSGVNSEGLAGSLVVAVAIAAALVGLIVSLGKVSGGHFNPLITIVQWALGERKASCTVAYVVAQIIGGIVGAGIARYLFDAAASPTPADVPLRLVCSELVAAAGLMIVVLGCARSSKWENGPFAVGAWLVAAIIATPSTSYANPAVTFAAIFAAGPGSVTLKTALAFAFAQSVGAALAVAFTKFVFPETTNDR